MEKIFSFLKGVERLKEMPKRGLVLMGVKNPETIADHIFFTMLSSWLLAKEKNIFSGNLLKASLFHDLGEVYAGDHTPFFYWDGLDIKKKEDREVLLKGVCLSLKERKKRAFLKFKKEKESLLKLISFLPPSLKTEVFSFWLAFAKGKFPFVKQVDRLETLLQSIFHLGTSPQKAGTSWLEGTKEIVHDPFLLDFLAVIKKNFYKTKEKISPQKEKRFKGILDFLMRIKKERKKQYHIFKREKRGETSSSHIFMVSIFCFLFSHFKDIKKERLIEMTLFSHLPYFLFTPFLEEQNYFSKKFFLLDKKVFLENFKREKRALEILTRSLPLSLRKEIFEIWEEVIFQKTREALFFNQIHLLYHFYRFLIFKNEKKYFFKNKRV